GGRRKHAAVRQREDVQAVARAVGGVAPEDEELSLSDPEGGVCPPPHVGGVCVHVARAEIDHDQIGQRRPALSAPFGSILPSGADRPLRHPLRSAPTPKNPAGERCPSPNHSHHNFSKSLTFRWSKERLPLVTAGSSSRHREMALRRPTVRSRSAP